MMGLFGRKSSSSTKHKLGLGAGYVYESDDGRATYVPPVSGGDTFTVPIAAVRGFVTTAGTQSLCVTLKVLGEGVELVEANVPMAASEKLQAWFREHPAFGG